MTHWEIPIAGDRLALLPLVVTVALGTAGGWVASRIGTPLPWLLGAVVAVGGAALAGLSIGGRPVTFPVKVRILFVPIIGVAIGGAFTPDLIAAAAGWWPTLIGLMLYVPLAHVVGYVIYRHLGRYDRATAYFSAMPGGLIEAIAMGEAAGADRRMLNLMQFSRLIMCILIVPLAITAYEGFAVGSAAGVMLRGAMNPIGLWDVAVLTASGALGFFAAHRVGMPAAIITGPIVFSGAAHLAGLTQADPPAFLIQFTQLVVGCGLGVRFVGLGRRQAGRGLAMAFLSVASVLGLAVAAGALLHGVVGESVEAVVLAFAPGGVTEMSLIALSLRISVVFVAAHHVARILYTVFLARLAWRWVERL
ncbi:AbrB family transcriptional regulator [Limibaculum sp. FT325]|uniref:AbrB family transcriptional regulator n=1 Tax=Thermohalobaculum sediminis TaxID=2939436 RepID=UPI0020BF8FED|nr:AbrB family transcriptional regulator [Limibaculum sediminis]MCL5777507.1 AbrB family transcriptional regulator [Limibaculum sediminis]